MLERINIKQDWLTHLAVSAAPGGFKIVVLGFLGYFGVDNAQGEFANELGIISFLTLLSSIGAGVLLLHIIPKAPEEEGAATQMFKGVLIRLLPYIFLICMVLYIFNAVISKVLNFGGLSSLLLFFVSIYWLFRHLHIARRDLASALIMEVIIWVSALIGLAFAFLFNEVTSEVALFILISSYMTALVLPTIGLVKVKPNYSVGIYKETLFISFSNLSSGGLMFLAPSICFHVGSPAIAGMVGLMTNTLAITLAGIRAYLNKIISDVSEKILKSDFDGCQSFTKAAQKKINYALLISAGVITPILIFVSIQTQPEVGLLDVSVYSILVLVFCYVPQFTAIDSIVMSFLGQSEKILLINVIHFLSVLFATYVLGQVDYLAEHIVMVFFATSGFFYVLRNAAVGGFVEKKIQSLRNEFVHNE